MNNTPKTRKRENKRKREKTGKRRQYFIGENNYYPKS